jgi:hypothetical protein
MQKAFDLAAPFACHGVEFTRRVGGQVVGGCPFCDSEQHLYVNPKTGQWDCKSCGESGNVVTFLTRLAEQCHHAATAEDWHQLAEHRGLPVAALKAAGLGWNGVQWLLPCYSPTDTVRDLRRWDYEKHRLMSTAGCEAQMWSSNRLAKAKKGTRVWVCEGEWDGIALAYVLSKCKRPDVVVAVPGAGTFKDAWVPLFEGMDVLLCYDNDDPGDAGSIKAAHKLADTTQRLRFVSWPETRPSGYDMRDFVRHRLAKGWTCRRMIRQLEQLVTKQHRRHAEIEGAGVEDKKDKNWPIEVGSIPASKIPTYAEVEAVFEKWLRMDDDLRTALKAILAVAASIDIPGDPLWLYVVGPPGCAKSVLLQSTRGSDRVVFRSSVTAEALVSGFQTRGDPSLLPQLNGKCGIFKDFTEMLSQWHGSREQVYGVLRGAYDRNLTRSYGNGVVRHYELSFSLLAGVTPSIHADKQATMGERFLKFEIREGRDHDADAVIRAAVGNIGKEIEMEKEMSEIVGRFLSRKLKPEKLPPVPEWFAVRVTGLVRLVAMLRAQVERDFRGEEILYRPTREYGTRLAKQLVLLARVLAWVLGRKEADEEIYRIIERVAKDTTIGFHLDLCVALLEMGGEARREDLAARSRVPLSTMARRLDDLEALGVLFRKIGPRPSGKRGAPTITWVVDDTVRELWERANCIARNRITAKVRRKGNGTAGQDEERKSEGADRRAKVLVRVKR